MFTGLIWRLTIRTVLRGLDIVAIETGNNEFVYRFAWRHPVTVDRFVRYYSGIHILNDDRTIKQGLMVTLIPFTENPSTPLGKWRIV